MTRLIHETLTLLYWSLLQPASFRRAVAEGKIELERARWQGLALVIGVPVAALLLLHGLAAIAHLPIDTAGARTFVQVSIAIASVFCLVGGVPEGVALGVAGGVVGVVIGSALVWAPPFPFDFSLLFGAALGMAYRTRQGAAGTWRAGIREALRGGFVFALVFGLEEGGFLFFNLWPGSELMLAFFHLVNRFMTTSWRAGVYFAVPFLLFYLGLLWYPLELLWAIVTRNDPARHDHLTKLPLPAPSIVGEDPNSHSL